MDACSLLILAGTLFAASEVNDTSTTDIFSILSDRFMGLESIDFSAEFSYFPFDSKAEASTDSAGEYFEQTEWLKNVKPGDALLNITLRFRGRSRNFRVDRSDLTPFAGSTHKITILSDGLAVRQFDWDELVLFPNLQKEGAEVYHVLMPMLVPFRFARCAGAALEYESLRDPKVWSDLGRSARRVGEEIVNGASCAVVEIECNSSRGNNTYLDGALYRLYLANEYRWYPVRVEKYDGGTARLTARFTALAMDSVTDQKGGNFYFFRRGLLERFDDAGELGSKNEMTVTSVSINSPIRDSVFSIPQSYIKDELRDPEEYAAFAGAGDPDEVSASDRSEDERNGPAHLVALAIGATMVLSGLYLSRPAK